MTEKLTITDVEGKTQNLSTEVFVLTSDLGMGNDKYNKGVEVRLISGVDDSPTPGHHRLPGYVTICRLGAKTAEFVGFKAKKMKPIKPA